MLEFSFGRSSVGVTTCSHFDNARGSRRSFFVHASPSSIYCPPITEVTDHLMISAGLLRFAEGKRCLRFHLNHGSKLADLLEKGRCCGTWAGLSPSRHCSPDER
eukprot:6306139-Amphidinium_carterae.1